MNVHHLELFYYVAKHQGVSAAARHIPYGIQQPAISAQVIQLEDNLGVTLFHRRPFALTSEGETLFQFIEPFFGQLTLVANQLRGGRTARLRIGAPPPIQHNYLPAMLNSLRAKEPDVAFSLATGLQDAFERLLLAGELDVAFTAFHGIPAAGIQTLELMQVPLALMVQEQSPVRDAEELWQRDRIEEPLLAVPSPEPVTVIFLQELQRRGIEWYPTLEVASLDIVSQYVAAGFGIGISVVQPDAKPPAGTRLLPLEDFPGVPYVAMWLGKANALIQQVLKEAQRIVKKLGA